jgi:hypothetical protein
MATIFTGIQAQDVNPVPSIHSAGEVHVAEGKYDALGTEVIADIIKLHRVPAGCIPIDCRLECDELDTGTAVLVSLALMEPGATDVIADSELVKTNTIGQAGGVVRMDQLDTARRAVLEVAVENERFVALKVTTAATTAAIGRIKSSVLFRAAEYNEK